MIRVLDSVFITDGTMSVNPPYSSASSSDAPMETYEDVRVASSIALGYMVRNQYKENSGLFVLRHFTKDRTYLSLVGGLLTEGVRDGRIKLHELTRVEKELDLKEHILRIPYHTNPVQIIADLDSSGILSMMRKIVKIKTRLTAVSVNDGEVIEIYKVPEAICEDIEILSDENIPDMYVADGHHRVSSYVAVDNEKGSMPVFLANIYDKSEVTLEPYNRVVQLPGKLPSLDLVETDGDDFDFLIKHKGVEIKGINPDKDSDQLLKRLNSYYVDQYILPHLGVKDTRTSEIVEFVPGSIEELDNYCSMNYDALSVFIKEPTIDQIMGIADERLIIPPKSTWFEPKINNLLFIYPYRWS